MKVVWERSEANNGKMRQVRAEGECRWADGGATKQKQWCTSNMKETRVVRCGADRRSTINS